MIDLKKFVSWTEEDLQNEKGTAKENRNTVTENRGTGTYLAKMRISQNIKFMGMGLKDALPMGGYLPRKDTVFKDVYGNRMVKTRVITFKANFQKPVIPAYQWIIYGSNACVYI
uniref:Uncharacterized protein n=1 Tax=Glossina pallidipes TaxID=7398 RepID=A0A1A9ZSJ7_GLOPL